jgi:hypothetical protein
MNEDPHERAERLIAQSRVEGIASADQQWLDAHIEECLPCAQLAKSTECALRALRTVSVSVSPGLVCATRHRVQARVQELRARRAQIMLLVIFCAMSWVLGIASAPLVWRMFSWLQAHTSAPAIIWQVGFAMWWVLPAAVAVIIIFVRSMQEATGDS